MVAPDLEELLSILLPPTNPVGAHGDWAAVEAELGLQLAEDYKQFISWYGAGTISGLIVVGNPFVQPVSPRKFWENWVDIYRDIVSYGVEIPFKLYPEHPGLLPCGDYADVNIINWLTNQDKQPCDLIFYSRSAGFFNLGRITLTRFIVQLLTGSTALPTSAVTNVLLTKPRQFMPGAAFA
jgi:hypothetical protein